MKCFLLMIALCGAFSSALPIVSKTEQVTEEDIQLAKTYLDSHYPDSEANRVIRSTDNNIVGNQLRQMQEFFQLEVTGNLDSRTLAVIKAPRCGIPDIGEYKTFPLSPKWSKKNLTYSIQNYTPDMAQDDVDEAIERAWKLWSDVTPLTFTRISGDSADIQISFGSREHSNIPLDPSFDGPGGKLAHAFSPADGGYAHFDEDENWTKHTIGINLFHVAAHEFGHALGLDHSNIQEALMFPIYNAVDPTKVRLHQDDINGIQSLYGPPEEDDNQLTFPILPTNIPAEECSIDICDPNLTFDSVTTLQGEMLFFKDSLMWRMNPEKIDIEQYHISTFWPALEGGIDAAYEDEDKKTLYIFKGQKYWAMGANVIPPGFPRNIHTLGFPKRIKKIDATVYDRRRKRTLFFSGDQYWRYDETKRSVVNGYPRKIATDFSGISSPVDAAFHHNGHFYLFSGSNQYEFDGKHKRFNSIKKRTFWFGCK
uniref:stromelysin-1-like n=1 Tax=Euleptes europaea TaxID=460621 RepID=UPI00253F9896|nr:stromelysin-1-like [Euleptes europaea]